MGMFFKSETMTREQALTAGADALGEEEAKPGVYWSEIIDVSSAFVVTPDDPEQIDDKIYDVAAARMAERCDEIALWSLLRKRGMGWLLRALLEKAKSEYENARKASQPTEYLATLAGDLREALEHYDGRHSEDGK